MSIEPRFVRKGCAEQLEIAILPQFLTIEPHFVRKGCAGHLSRANLKSQFYLSFWRSSLIWCDRVRGTTWSRNFTSVFGTPEIAILLQFLAIEPRFVRKGCVSCRLVGTAPAPAFRREIEKKERARGQEEKMWRCEDVKMWRCEAVKMWRCEDEKMWRWEDEKIWRSEDVKMWRWEDVKMRRWDTDPHYWKNPALRRSRELSKNH